MRPDELVSELEHDLVGQRFDEAKPVLEITAIRLLTANDEIPPRIAVVFTADGRPGVWEDTWSWASLARYPTVGQAAGLFGTIVYANLREWADTGSPPPGLRMT